VPQSGCDKASAYEVHPKLMPWNPRRHDRRDALCHREMFGAEGRDRRRVEKRPEQSSLSNPRVFCQSPRTKIATSPIAKTTPKARYGQITWLGIATKAMTADEFTKLQLTTIPFLPVSPGPDGFLLQSATATSQFCSGLYVFTGMSRSLVE
jgi:hypothetical protein